MAEIPVEKKSSLAWLWWLLLLAGIAALIWWLVAADDGEADLNDDVVVEESMDDPAMMDSPDAMAGAAGTVVSIDALSSLGNRIGEDVELDTVEVNRVVGDMGFTVGEGANETLVRFDEVQTPDTAREGLIDVNPGSVVALAGNVQSLDLSSMPDTVQADLDGTNSAYIRAARVNVQDGGVNPR